MWRASPRVSTKTLLGRQAVAKKAGSGGDKLKGVGAGTSVNGTDCAFAVTERPKARAAASATASAPDPSGKFKDRPLAALACRVEKKNLLVKASKL